MTDRKSAIFNRRNVLKLRLAGSELAALPGIASDKDASCGNHYDVVQNMEMVEHVPDVPAFMSECTRLVRPDGAMALATINRTPKSFLFAIFGAEYVLRRLPRGTHRWDRFVRPAEEERLLKRDGLRVTDRTGVRVNPYTRAFYLVRDLSVNFTVYATREVAA